MNQMNNIDMELSLNILQRYNNGLIGNEKPITVKDLPTNNNENIIQFDTEVKLSISQKDLLLFAAKFNIPLSIVEKFKSDPAIIDSESLEEIGIYLYPYFSFGILNGGSATSYVDTTKNEQFNSEIYTSNKTFINELKPIYSGKAKGITPAFINPDKSTGPSFMELKFRYLLLQSKEYRNRTMRDDKNLFPVFQMTSSTNNDEIMNHYKELKNSYYLKDLLQNSSSNILNVISGIQPLITAYTHSSKGTIKDFFKTSDTNYLPLPGGHGQCFYVLKSIFQELYMKGIRFISLGNVDNIGYNIDPKILSLLALNNKDAMFEFSYKTEIDTKGGVLVLDDNNRLNCADLGVTISKEEIKNAETSGKPILFNCASGYFNLEILLSKIDFIIDNLPTRFSDQNKDIGIYSQAEQVTWEVISLLDNISILAVNKYDRFLASKLLIENLLTSGVINVSKNNNFYNKSLLLKDGLDEKLKTTYKLYLKNNRWESND
ncbi:MAG: UTP--glucose-1-phosphate uridylyltransferase [Spirochaetales bacterium]|nr:UTP--glucose-1-phosphate uridylyltransferase [Spirochaetales bacterium]